MSAAKQLEKDLETVKAGVLAGLAPSNKRPPPSDKEMAAMFDAGFRIVGGVFRNLQRIADSLEEISFK